MFNIVPYSRKNGGLTRKDDLFGIDRFFEDFFRDPFFARVSSMTTPIKADVRETDKEYIIEAELPGVNKEDIVIDLHDDVLTLGVDIKQEKDEESEGYIYKERQRGSYRRSFNVNNIDNEKVKASYKDGILVVNLPKSEEEQKTRKINIE